MKQTIKHVIKKLTPETPVTKAVSKTVAIVLTIITMLTIAVTNTPLFGAICLLALISFFINTIYNHLLKAEKKKVNKGVRR